MKFIKRDYFLSNIIYRVIFFVILLSFYAFTQESLAFQQGFNMCLTSGDALAGAGDGSDSTNVHYAKANYHATAILLRINWKDIQPNSSTEYNWAKLDSAIDRIRNCGLNLSVRFCIGAYGLPTWAYPGQGVFSNSDFMADQTGSIRIRNGSTTTDTTSYIFSFANANYNAS